jgi:hypothetical protein
MKCISEARILEMVAGKGDSPGKGATPEEAEHFAQCTYCCLRYTETRKLLPTLNKIVEAQRQRGE